nr:MAG TPA: hypothetical protein [Caudoviricetes sp.]
MNDLELRKFSKYHSYKIYHLSTIFNVSLQNLVNN